MPSAFSRDQYRAFRSHRNDDLTARLCTEGVGGSEHIVNGSERPADRVSQLRAVDFDQVGLRGEAKAKRIAGRIQEGRDVPLPTQFDRVGIEIRRQGGGETASKDEVSGAPQAGPQVREELCLDSCAGLQSMFVDDRLGVAWINDQRADAGSRLHAHRAQRDPLPPGSPDDRAPGVIAATMPITVASSPSARTTRATFRPFPLAREMPRSAR